MVDFTKGQNRFVSQSFLIFLIPLKFSLSVEISEEQISVGLLLYSRVNLPFFRAMTNLISDAFFLTERTVYAYPDVTISPDQVVDHPLGMVTLAPFEGLCKTKAIDECTNECTRCQNECLYNMELHRSGSACNKKGELKDLTISKSLQIRFIDFVLFIVHFSDYVDFTSDVDYANSVFL